MLYSIRLFPLIAVLLIILSASAAGMDRILFSRQTKIKTEDRVVVMRNRKIPAPEVKAELVLKEQFTISAEAGPQMVTPEDPTYLAAGDHRLI